MRRHVLSLVVVLIAFCSWGSAARAGIVYVSRPFDAFGTVDLTTGVYSQIGTTSVQLDALTFAPSGILYGIGSNNHLYQVNTATAGLTDLGATGSGFGLVALAGRGDGALFGSDPFSNGPGGFVYSVNPSTGVATSIGQTGLSGGFVSNGDLAFGPGNTLFLDYGLNASNYALYTVNQSSGTATMVGDTGVSTDGLVFSGGTAYGFDFFGEIYTFSATTGAATDTHIAITGGFGEVEGAAAAPAAANPEPASLTLLAFGAAGLVGYAWRRRARAAASVD